MNRWMMYHRDGTVRMDYYTFRNLKMDRVMSALTSHKAVRVPRKGKVSEFK